MASTTPNQLKWAIIKEVKLVWCNWDSEYIFFNSTSGDTHQFDYITAQLVKLLIKTAIPLNINTIEQELLETCLIDDIKNLKPRVNQILSHLKKLDIIENVQ